MIESNQHKIYAKIVQEKEKKINDKETLEICYLSSHENYNQIYYPKFQKFNNTLTCIKTRPQKKI